MDRRSGQFGMLLISLTPLGMSSQCMQSGGSELGFCLLPGSCADLKQASQALGTSFLISQTPYLSPLHRSRGQVDGVMDMKPLAQSLAIGTSSGS